jgi:aryl-alcohol dehydrogenase-like predicted oxidoreductase
MEYRQLGRSGLRISTLGFGTGTWGGGGVLIKWGNTDVAGAKKMVDTCLDAGINWIDTANAYSTGVAEEITGEALGKKRDQLLLFTKVRFPMGQGPNDRGLSRYHIIQQAEASLKRLKTDRIDLYQVHEWDGLTPLEETLHALDTLVRDGKVRYIGVSNYSAWHLMKALAISDSHLYQRFVSQQIHYTLEAREAEYELVPLSLDQGLGILVWSPLAGGWLTGKYRRNQPIPEGTRVAQKFPEPPVYNQERLWDIIEVLVAIGQARKVSAAQVALAWLLGRPGVTGIVLGARTDAQLADNLKAAELVLTDDERGKLDEVSKPNLIYPYWHQVLTAKDRFGPADQGLLSGYLKV